MASEYRLQGVGMVSLEELEARFSAYLNAGAPKPILEASLEEQHEVYEKLASRGDSQMRALMSSYLGRPDAPERAKTQS